MKSWGNNRRDKAPEGSSAGEVEGLTESNSFKALAATSTSIISCYSRAFFTAPNIARISRPNYRMLR